MDYAKAIRVVRVARRIAQKTLAERTELNPSYVSLLESGRRTPSTEAIESIAKALDVPVGLFLLLAAEPHDLKGLPDEQARDLSGLLLSAVLGLDDDKPTTDTSDVGAKAARVAPPARSARRPRTR